MKIPEENGADYSPSAAIDLIVPSELGGQRLDQVLAVLLAQYSRSRLQVWIRGGLLAVDGEPVVDVRKRMLGGERLFLRPGAQAPEEGGHQAEEIGLDVVFEDAHLLVINKPAGLVVHPGNGHWQGTLLNALLHHCPDATQLPRAGIVHRLDKDTTGLMVVAKTLEAQTDLVRQLQARSVNRQYLALAQGVIERNGTVEAPIGRHPVQRTKMAVLSEARGGKPAVTHYRVLERFARCTLLECALETGRTHQIRVHMASIKHPLVGDPVYAPNDARFPVFHRQALHATRLGLLHPVDGQAMQWERPAPPDLQQLLESLRHG